MEKKRFEQLFSDKQSVLVGTIGGGLFHDSNKEIVLEFLFMHNGDFSNRGSKPCKRLFISHFPYKNLNEEIPTLLVNDKKNVLANADIFEYALAYEISIDTQKRVVKTILVEKPVLGESFLTAEELDGIEIYY